jgi:hypothetical protein
MNLDFLARKAMSTLRRKTRQLYKDQESARLYIERKSELCKHYKIQKNKESKLKRLLKDSMDDKNHTSCKTLEAINKLDS